MDRNSGRDGDWNCIVVCIFADGFPQVGQLMEIVWVIYSTGTSDALFTPKMDIFKQTILKTAYIKALEIFQLDRESLSIQTSISRSVSNQSRLHGS